MERTVRFSKILIACAVLAVLLAGVCVRGAPEAAADVQADAAAQLALKIGALQEQQEKGQTEISRKLDQVLANQAKILNELEIVKVRATLRP